MEKKVYRAYYGELDFPFTDSSRPNTTWSKLAKRLQCSPETLRIRGYVVKRITIDAEPVRPSRNQPEPDPVKRGIIARLWKWLGF